MVWYLSHGFTAEVKHFPFLVYVRQEFNLLILIKSLLLFNYFFYRDGLYVNNKNAAVEPFLTVFQFTALLFVHLNSVIIYLFVCLSII